MAINAVLIRWALVPVAFVVVATASDSPASEQGGAALPDVRREVVVSKQEQASTSEPLPEILLRQAPGLHLEALELALRAAENAARKGFVKRRELLTVIDYSLPSTEPRLFVFDLERRELLFRELVAHGKNSGENHTTRFSNEERSLATSLGLFVTEETYIGGNGYSLRLNGLDPGFNDQAMSRSIVMHGAPYVSESMVKKVGRIGRSWGCPAVAPEVAKELIDTVKGGSPVFAYYPDPNWIRTSRLLNASEGSDAATLNREPAIR